MQGFNMGRYYPPPESDTSPTFNKSHPLGQRARKLRSEGILTVRFEMPFAIWCDSCPRPTIIGQGVRFNAEKKKVGNYHSTSIWQFRMKHTACGGWIEIRTDPKATEYVVVEGAKRRDYGDERREEEVGVLDLEERDRRREDAMAGLEGKRDEEQVKKDSGRRINELLQESDKWWGDPYQASKFVRKGFRQERKERAREGEKTQQIKDRLNLDIEILPESEADKRRAQLVDFGDWSGHGADAAVSRPLYQDQRRSDPEKVGSSQTRRSTRSEGRKATVTASLGDRLRQNTRASNDPFLHRDTQEPKPVNSVRGAVAGIKRQPAAVEPAAAQLTTSTTTGPLQLVAYDSD